MTHSRFWFSKSAAFVLTCAMSAAAQDTATVPRELVSALLGHESVGDLRVDGVPDGFPAEAILPDAAVVGSLAFPTRTTLVMAVAGSTEVAQQALETRLLASGWRREPGGSRQGFVSMTRGFGLGFCRRDDYLAPTFIPRTHGGTLVKLYWDRSDRGRCESAARRSRPHLEAPVPRLMAPERARELGGGGGGDRDTSDTYTRLASDMTVAELMSYYAEQLRRAGWIASEEAAAGPSSVQVYRFTGRDGRSWWGVLNVIALPDSALRFVHLRLGPHEALPRPNH